MYVAEMDYQNFRSDKVFDFSNRLQATVSATRGVWVSRGQSIFPKWQDGKVVPHERYPQVISVSYRASGKNLLSLLSGFTATILNGIFILYGVGFGNAGQLGRVDAFTAVMNIAVSAAIFGVAKFICDFAGDSIVHEFYDKRYLDHGDYLAIQTLKDKVWDEDKQCEKSKRDLIFAGEAEAEAQKKWGLSKVFKKPAWFKGSKRSQSDNTGQSESKAHASASYTPTSAAPPSDSVRVEEN